MIILTLLRDAPFFLPTVPASSADSALKFDVETKREEEEEESAPPVAPPPPSALAKDLLAAESEEELAAAAEKLQALGPAALEVQLR